MARRRRADPRPGLDVGCGTGELTLFLVRRGHDVLGIDLSRLAIEQARGTARWRRVDAHFLAWDVLDHAGLAAAGLSFRTVADSAMVHLLGDRERDRFAAGLETVVPPGGRYDVLGNAGDGGRIGYGITPDELRARFDAVGGWEVVLAEETAFERRWNTNPACLVGVERR